MSELNSPDKNLHVLRLTHPDREFLWQMGMGLHALSYRDSWYFDKIDHVEALRTEAEHNFRIHFQIEMGDFLARTKGLCL